MWRKAWQELTKRPSRGDLLGVLKVIGMCWLAGAFCVLLVLFFRWWGSLQPPGYHP
jgi:hypothetical protein